MSNIDKQARDKLKSAAAKAADNFDPNMFVETRDVLGLLDELEAKDAMIAAQQHEIRTLLNALEGRPCPKCNDTGMADSGGTQPWGEPISVPCDCAAPPAPVSVPAAMEMDDDFDSAFEHGKAVGWNAYRAAMLQGAVQPQNQQQNIPENIPATQFKPVADLYGLTSPTGGETSFTFDAVEARDFIDGGWSCQEYVELERFHEAITNHTEDKLAMVDHSGDSNNMVEPVTTTYKLPFEQWLSKQTGTIDVEYGCVMTEVFFHWLRVAYDAGNSPVIADGWVILPAEPTQAMMNAWLSEVANWRGHAAGYRAMIAAAPQQEVK